MKKRAWEEWWLYFITHYMELNGKGRLYDKKRIEWAKEKGYWYKEDGVLMKATEDGTQMNMIEVDQKVELMEVIPVEEAPFDRTELNYSCPYCGDERKDFLWHSPSPEEIEWNEDDEAYIRRYCMKCERWFYIRVKRIPGATYLTQQVTARKWLKEETD